MLWSKMSSSSSSWLYMLVILNKNETTTINTKRQKTRTIMTAGDAVEQDVLLQLILHACMHVVDSIADSVFVKIG